LAVPLAVPLTAEVVLAKVTVPWARIAVWNSKAWVRF
jgi:hypothetical protein